MHGWKLAFYVLASMSLLATILAVMTYSGISDGDELAPAARGLALGFFVLPALILTTVFFVAARVASTHQNTEPRMPNEDTPGNLGSKLVDFGYRLAILGVAVKLLTTPWKKLSNASEFVYLILPALAMWALPGLLMVLVGFWLRGRDNTAG